MRLPLSILLILFSSAVLLVQAKPIVLEESESIIAIEDNLQILPDSEGQWDLEQVRLKTFQSFDPEAKLSKAYVYWAKFEVQNPRDEAVRWVLSPDWRKGTLRNSLVEVYVLTESGNPRILHTGKYLPLSQKDGIAKVYPHNQVEIALDALEKKEIYIRVEPIEQRRPVFVVRLMTYDYWLDQAPILRNILQAIFHAIMWFMFFSSLLNYFSQKSNAYLYYALFLASASFYFLSVSGMLMEIFLQENPKANSFVWVFASNLIGIGYFQFARSFLNTKRLMPLYDKIGRWIIIGALILIGVELIILQLTFNFDFLEKLNRGVLFAEVTFLLIVSLLYARHSKGVSRIFFWGTLCIVASGYLGLILNQMGLFHASLPAVEFLFVVQTLNFSWGLGYRQYQMQEERIEKRAEAANLRTLNEMKSRFFANISHEFRTPLTLLLGESESLQSEGESYTPTKRGEKLGVIRRMGQNLLELVNQILDLSKLDARSYEADWQYGDIISFVKGQSDAFESFAVSQQLDYRFESERDALHMDFDPKAVQTILSNLLSNAIKFTPKEGEVKLLLRVEDGPQMEEVLVLEVVDTGYGIPQADLTHLFDRYFQSSQNRSNAAGTGIGLSLVKALVQMMGGEISVQSELEQGTSFLVRLPVNHLHQSTTVAEPFAMPDPVIETPRVETQQSLSLSDFEKNLVLIVEDNPEVLHFVRSILETDYRVAIARDGAEGERLALELIPDLIVSDVGMPVMDGFQLTERLKQDERTSHIPVVLLTARAEEKDRLQGLSFGADAYLTKPFRQAELKVRIEKLIEVREKLRLRFAGLPAEESPKPPSREEIFLQQIKDIILGNLLNPELNPDLLAEKMNMSYTQLYRKLKALTNQSANLLIREVRLEKAAEMLQQSDEGIAEIAYACGFNDPAYFSRAFSTKYGMPPSLYRDSR